MSAHGRVVAGECKGRSKEETGEISCVLSVRRAAHKALF